MLPVALCLLALLLVLHWVSRPAAVRGVVNVVSVLAVPGAGGTGLPPVPREVALPHILDDAPPELRSRVDYLFSPSPEMVAQLQQSGTQPPGLALLLPRVGTRFRVLLNGQELFQEGWYDEPGRVVNAGWFPYFVPLPAALLDPELPRNVVRVEVKGQLLERSGLAPFQVGAFDTLYDRYKTLYGWQVIGTWMMLITAVLMGLMSLFLWLLLRERLFALMAAASLAHAVRLVLSVLADPPLTYELYFLLHRVSFAVYVAFICLFIEEMVGLRLRLVRGLAYFLLAAAPAWMGWTLYTLDYDNYRIWAGVLAFTAATSLGYILWVTRAARSLSPNLALVLMVALFTLATGVRDFLVVQLNFPGDADLRWTSLGSLTLMFTLGWVLMQRSTASVAEVRRLNDSLAKVVAEREGQLRLAFNQLRESERQRAVESERQRLVRDMHDGLGSQLVQTLNMVHNSRDQLDRSQLTTMISHALDELRITLDSLEPMEGDLPTILGTLRQRIAPALQSAGIQLDWQVQEVPVIPALDSQGVMHLFRCVQEVFANVVKHSGATRLTVRTGVRATGDGHGEVADGVPPGSVVLSIEDNGRGMSEGLRDAVGGRGLKNIRLRAEKMGARVVFSDTHPGTTVVFCFPVGTRAGGMGLTRSYR